VELLYTKYNRYRLPQFQVETSIFNDHGKRIVVKKALTPEARAHVQEMVKNYTLIKEHIVDNRIHLPKGLIADDRSIQYDYVEGCSYDNMLFKAFLDRDGQRMLNILDDYVNILKGSFKTADQPVITDRMKQVFGLTSPDQLNHETPCFALSLVDPVFENIIVSHGRNFLIDNEWVFDGCLPVSFVLFRSLFYFYQVKYSDFDIESLVSFKTVLSHCSLGPEIVKRYREMDDCFQVSVFGEDRRYQYKFRYVKPFQSLPLLETTIKNQSVIINKQYEVIQVQKKQIPLLIQQIKDKDQLLFDIVNTRGWKLVQFMTRVRDRLLPPDTCRRRVASRLFNCLMKLGRSFRRRSGVVSGK